MLGKLAMVALFLVALASGSTIQEDLYNITMSAPGVAESNVLMDQYGIVVSIYPEDNASSQNLSESVAYVVAGYAGFLKAAPDYNGYLKIKIAKGWDGGYMAHVMKAYPKDAREATKSGDFINYTNKVIQSKQLVGEGTIPFSAVLDSPSD